MWIEPILQLLFLYWLLICGFFGGAKGIKELFFSNPNIEIEGFMPIEVWDDDFNLESMYPSFLFGGLLIVKNKNNLDVSISEMRIYGISRDTSGYDQCVLTYGQPNYTHIYKLDITGQVYGNSIIKSYKSDYLQFKFAYFKTNMEPKFKNLPYKSSHSVEYGQPIEYVIVPMYNNIFKYNDKHSPEYLVNEVLNGELIFAVYFNGTLVKVSAENQVAKEIVFDKRYLVVAANRAELNAIPHDEWFHQLQDWLVQRGMPLNDANIFIKKINKLTRNEISDQLHVVLRTPKLH